MLRINEITSGNVAVIGKKSVLNNIFHHIVEHCRTSGGKTFVLCGDSVAPMSADDNVRMGVYPEYSELLPDFLEPFLSSPSTGGKLENIISAMSDMFFASASGTATNDQYFIGYAEILFCELIKYSLMMMRKKGDYSFASFANCYTELCNEFPAMIAYSANNNPTRNYSYTSGYLDEFEDEGESPFSQTLIGNNPTTANNVEGTLRVHAPRMREFMSLVSNAHQTAGIPKFSFLDNIKQKQDGVVFLQAAPSVQTYQKLLLTFICEGLKLLAESHPQTQFRLVVPDICYWKNPVIISQTLQSAPRNLSVIWGVSNMGVLEQLSKSHEKLGDSIVSMSDTQVWARSGDASAQRIYEGNVPEVSRTYRLAQIPERLCYVKSDTADFGSVKIPDAPQAQVSQDAPEYSGTISLWMNEQNHGRTNNNDDENSEHTAHHREPDIDDISFDLGDILGHEPTPPSRGRKHSRNRR